MEKKKIRALVYDFDGVMTDNRVLVLEDGREAVFCNRSDGLMVGILREKGYQQFILTSEQNPVVKARAAKLKIPVYTATANPETKGKLLEQLLTEHGLEPSQVAYVGNDLNDVECFKKVGLTFAPSDSHPAILKLASHILPTPGGSGVLRHILDYLE